MPRATCRCGQKLSFPADGPDRVICPKCQSRIRVRRRDAAAGAGAGAGGKARAATAAAASKGDGFIRFNCPCGRRLKVRAATPRPESGRCPDCGRTVPVPSTSTALPPSTNPVESPTAEMDPADRAELARWAESYRKTAQPAPAPAPVAAVMADSPGMPMAEALRTEAGLRICPRCGRPVHLGADACRQCGAHVPRR